MPIYEYRCPKGHLFDVLHRMDEPQPEVCEVCGAGPLEKVLHPVPIFFKGKGFYSTDYGKGKRKRESREGETTKPAESTPKAEKTDVKKTESA